jgi:hypothetical protein
MNANDFYQQAQLQYQAQAQAQNQAQAQQTVYPKKKGNLFTIIAIAVAIVCVIIVAIIIILVLFPKKKVNSSGSGGVNPLAVTFPNDPNAVAYIIYGTPTNVGSFKARTDVTSSKCIKSVGAFPSNYSSPVTDLKVQVQPYNEPLKRYALVLNDGDKIIPCMECSTPSIGVKGIVCVSNSSTDDANIVEFEDAPGDYAYYNVVTYVGGTKYLWSLAAADSGSYRVHLINYTVANKSLEIAKFYFVATYV